MENKSPERSETPNFYCGSEDVITALHELIIRFVL